MLCLHRKSLVSIFTTTNTTCWLWCLIRITVSALWRSKRFTREETMILVYVEKKIWQHIERVERNTQQLVLYIYSFIWIHWKKLCNTRPVDNTVNIKHHESSSAHYAFMQGLFTATKCHFSFHSTCLTLSAFHCYCCTFLNNVLNPLAVSCASAGTLLPACLKSGSLIMELFHCIDLIT